jgi:adenine-specific DNA-methyltransferase
MDDLSRSKDAMDDLSRSKDASDTLEERLSDLISYSENQNPFNEEETKVLINAIDNCKILDPACGSGAFPMGILHKLVHILHKLDPNNRLWKERQIEKAQAIEDSEIRNKLIEDIETAFENNELDYGRKLYLIENCIYGVDIQPIATQISKLRFFISLIVDQKCAVGILANGVHNNFGIRPLPNLETKFVAANTLIGIEKPDGVLRNLDLDKIEANLKKVRHRLFSAKTPATKRKLREEDQRIREEMGELLVQSGWGNESARQLAAWDPYNQNVSSGWFDPEWMFGVDPSTSSGQGGFDVVIGNPPYISAPTMVTNYADFRKLIVESKKYNTLYQKWDLYIPFMELGLQSLNSNGVFSMIVPYPFTNQTYGLKLRELIINDYCLKEIVDLNGTKVFENATVSNCIPFITKSNLQNTCFVSNVNQFGKIEKVFNQSINDLVQDKKTLVWNLTSEKRDTNKYSKFNVLGDFCYISVGMVLNADEKTAKGEFSKDDLISETYDKIHCRKYIEAKDIEKYRVKNERYLEYNTKRSPAKLRRPTFRELYEKPKLMFNRLGNLMVIIDDEVKYLHSDSMFSAVLWKDLDDVENKSISASVKRYSKLSRKEMSKLSFGINLKYLLGVLNSKYASVLLTNLRAGDYHIYPEHIRNIPIPNVEKNQQKPIICLVDKVISAKKSDPNADTSALETQVDQLVYKLYDLTEEEIAIVEGSVK